MKYIAEYKCGCSDGPAAKRDMIEYCPIHGADLRRWIPDLSQKKTTEKKTRADNCEEPKMTEPQKMGIQEVMELVNAFERATLNGMNAAQGIAWRKIAEALTTIIEERDRWEKHYRELIADLMPETACLPDSKCDSYGHDDECPAVNAQASVRKLRARVVVLEMAVKNYAGSSKDGVNFCRICTEYNFAPNPVNHRPDCIMRIVETKEPQ